ncbi:MAG: CHAD domain-containing protein [Pseudomonadota bacterium]|nr:CHAD domain-containing protein [Pseudomonadota bacterium]
MTKHLFLVRHAKSSWDDDNLSDRERPLNARGEQQLLPLARALRLSGGLKGTVYASDAVRAQMTLGGLQANIGGLPSNTEPELYTFDYKRLAAWLQAMGGNQERVTLIGHNPALLELTAWLVKNAPFELPTASFVHLVLPIRRWQDLGKHMGKLETFLTPKDFSYQQFERKHRKQMTDGKPGANADIASALSQQMSRLQQLERGVMLGLDPEFLHQYRIALRRSRSIAESVAEVTGTPSLRPFLAQFKRHARATSLLRDLHVFQDDIPQLCGDNHELARALSAWAELRSGKAQKQLVKRLTSKRYQDTLSHWDRHWHSKAFRERVRDLKSKDIRKRIERQCRRFNRNTAELLHTSPDDDIHELRKQLKRLRYLMELDARTWKDSLKTMKQRQDLYGRFQDLCTQIDLMDSFLPEAPRSVQEALVKTIERLDAEKQAVRKDILALGGLNLPV